MAKQLDLLTTGQIITTALHVEMERSYLEYAMSVIVGRALPDVRDGLKPVHRRILYAMHELGLTPDRPYRKCARVVGDVLGKYHPHGDQSVYDALVRMVQDFSSRYPLLAGHGNFGSVDDDPPAAMRYTETRLASIAHQAMLSDISEAIVDFTSNFDNSQQEPVVLPAQLPLLLLNGCSGIAVGMATNIPPHNLSEVVDGLVALIDNPQLADEKLWQIIPAPDFPTGGEIVDKSGIIEAYRTGRGIITVRGVARVETVHIGKRRQREGQALVITELPYQVNKSAWIEKVAELVNQGRLEGISDLRDESDRNGMRVVIELKRDTNPRKVVAELYQHTALQTNFGAIMLALVDNKPTQLSLRQLLEEFLRFREETLTRQYSNELEQSQKRLHLLSGLLVALNNLDAVIDILRNAPDGTTAKASLQERLEISDSQADSILAMPMRRLTGLERQKLQTEHEELETRINQLQILLSDRNELMKSLKKELRSLKRQFGDERRTRIVSQPPQNQETRRQGDKGDKDSRGARLASKENKDNKGTTVALKEDKATKKKPSSISDSFSLPLFSTTPTEDSVLEITHKGYIYWHPPEPKTKVASNNKDFAIYTQVIGQREQLLIITDSGKAYPLAVKDIPLEGNLQKTVMSLLPGSAQRDSERVVAHFFLPQEKNKLDFIFLTEKGKIKRSPVSELEGLGNRGLALVKLKEDDRLSYVCLAQEKQDLAIATTGGRILRFAIDDAQIPLMGRSAQGNQILRLRYGENLAGCVAIAPNGNLLLVSMQGYGKRLPISSLRLAKLGDIGTQAMHFTSKTDNLAAMVAARSGTNIILLTNSDRCVSISVDSVVMGSKDSTGDRVAKLKSEEAIVFAQVVG
jgi:DNA gyrase subunit A